MRYLSLFDGIGAVHAAWQSLGWTCVATAEIDAFPAAVVEHHHGFPNLGDVTQITDAQIAALGPIDLVVGGSPCQDLSVAGKRKGMAGARSGLFYDQLRIFHAARTHCGARLLLWENVPGAFSTHAGRDFACVVGAMAGCEIVAPADGWRSEGVALGANGLVEWCVLDAQWFGVAQRRRRVFALLDVGAWADRAPILLEPESLRGDSAPRRETGQGVAGIITRRIDRGGVNSEGGDGHLIPHVAGCLNSAGGHAVPGNSIQDADQGYLIPSTGDISHFLNAGGMGRQDYETETLVPMVAFSCKDHGADADDIAPTLRSMGHDGSHANGGGQVEVAFANTAGATNLGISATGEAPPITTRNGDPGNVCIGMQVRRLTPRECERLQGFPDDYTAIQVRGKPAADGPRYKALGNSMAVPVMRWIGERIAATTTRIEL